MTTERQACGLGSFLPMSCRGRAEAFARRLQSRLQSLGRAGSGDGSSTPEETSWLGRQPEVTSHQPRLSSSSESDIYFDFDLDCESPGSPIDEPTYSETLPDYLVNKSRTCHLPPKSQYSSESGCAMSPHAMTGTSPGSDSSDGPYFDPENLDGETSHRSQNHHITSINLEDIGGHRSFPESEASERNAYDESDTFGNCSYGELNGHGSDSSCPTEDGKRRIRRNFRNAAGFRIPNTETKKENDELPEKLLNTDSSDTIEPTLNGKSNNRGSLSNDSSTTEEYFECLSLKTEESLCEDLNSLCMHDSGFTNTAETSRCNSQNENLSPQLQSVDCNNDITLNVEYSNTTHEDSNTFTEKQNELLPTSCFNQPHTEICEPCDSFQPPDISPENGVQTSDEKTVSSFSESSCTPSPNRPSNLSIECSSLSASNASASHITTETWTSSGTAKHIDDDEDDDKTIPRVRRCSSLKTGKTPPGTPSRKKIVRFADVLGLDLADIRTFLDEIPKVPRSAYEDLECVDIPDTSSSSILEDTLSTVLPSCMNIKSDRCLICLFQQPAGLPDFMDRVREEQVCLENAILTDTVSFTICGTVRVRNLDFHKSVHIRYSIDNWETFADLQATYVPNSCDGFSDKFSFTLYAHTVQIGQRLQFAVRFQCKGVQYWDSNHGANYVFQCLPPTDRSSFPPIPISPDEHFSSSFY
ncbi:hypothetical protein C0J52_13888 [Blattella germanica]|nr:hypothetical protein C0J52_13888 [Blattella germanica]